MEGQNWRAVWEEARATMLHLERSLETARDLERTALIQQHASVCSAGVMKTLSAIQEGIRRARRQVRAADLNLRLANAELAREPRTDDQLPCIAVNDGE